MTRRKLKTFMRFSGWLPGAMRERIVRSRMTDPYPVRTSRHECIFVHIPKCAGVSVSDALFGGVVGHRPIIDFKAYSRARFERYFKFTFVRNPWDRAVSAFHFLKRGGMNAGDREWAAKNLSAFSDFREFAVSLSDEQWARRALREVHFMPQFLYIADERQELAVDFVGRVENIEEDFHLVCERIGVEAELKHLNRSSRQRAYIEHYDERSARIIAALYAEDIGRFGYLFAE